MAEDPKIAIELHESEWRSLTNALRKASRTRQIQLGRLPWMVVAAIEAALPPVPKKGKS